MKREPAVYILTNKHRNTLYTGVTGNLVDRITQHKERQVKGFSKKYNCTCLVYVATFPTMFEAIEHEKQIKGGSRIKKLKLIESVNPAWDDLSKEL